MNYSWISHEFSQFFSQNFSNFFPIFFSKFFCQNFPQSCFGIYFEGFARDTRVLRAPHAGFFSWLYEWENFFPQNFFQDFFLKNSWIIRKFRELLMNYSWIIHDYSWISHEFSQFFSQNFSNFFSNFFFQIFLSKFSSKLFRDLFRGVRARHTRVASTPRGIFLVIIWMRKFFSQNFFQIFFQIFFPNFFVKIFLKIVSGFISRGSRETHACCEHPTRDFSRDYMNEKIFFPRIFSKIFFQFFFPNFFVKIFLKIVLGFISRGSRETHACCEQPTRDFSCVYMNEKIFFPRIFFKFLFQFFFPNFFVKFSSKLFWDLFRGVRARHTRVASTPRGIFLVTIWMRKFFFPEFFSNFFSNFFFPNFFVKIFLKIFSQNFFPCCYNNTWSIAYHGVTLFAIPEFKSLEVLKKFFFALILLSINPKNNPNTNSDPNYKEKNSKKNFDSKV